MGLTEDKMSSIFAGRPGVKLELFCDVLSYQQHPPPILILSQQGDVFIDGVNFVFSQ